jgi:hypothetical protein
MAANKTKPTGRPAGTPNKATSNARAAIALFVDRNASRLEGWLDQVAEENPAKAFELFQTVVEYHIPKLARTELTGEGGKDLIPTTLTVNFVSGKTAAQTEAKYGQSGKVSIHMSENAGLDKA